MNKKVLLFCIFCIISYQTSFKSDFFRSLQEFEELPAEQGPIEAVPYFEINPKGQLPVLIAEPLSDFDIQINMLQDQLKVIDGEIQVQTEIFDSDDFDASLLASNKLLQLNFKKDKIKREIFNINQDKQQDQMQKQQAQIQQQIDEQQKSLNQLLGKEYQNVQIDAYSQMQSIQNAEEGASALAQATQAIDDLIQQALGLNESIYGLIIQFKNSQIDYFNQNIDTLAKDNASNSSVSPQGKQDVANLIGNMKKQVDSIKKEISANVSSKNAKAKQIQELKSNFLIVLRQNQENQLNQIQILNAQEKYNNCINDKSLGEQADAAQADIDQLQGQLNEALAKQQDGQGIRDQISNSNFKLKSIFVSQIRYFLSCNELRLQFNSRQESSFKLISAQLEKNKSFASSQEKVKINQQQEKIKQQLADLAAEQKLQAEEKSNLNKRLQQTMNTQFVQDQNVRQNKADIDNLINQLEEVRNKINEYQKNIQNQIASAADCKQQLEIAQNQLGNLKEFQELANNAKQVNDKLNAINKSFIDNSNLQVNTNLQDLNKQLSALKSTDNKVPLQQQIASQNAQLANIKQIQAKSLESYQNQDKQIQGMVGNFQNQLNNFIAQAQYDCNADQIIVLDGQINELDAQLAELKEQLASSQISESEKITIRITYVTILTKRVTVVHTVKKIQLYQVTYKNTQSSNNVKSITAQIAECKQQQSSGNKEQIEKCSGLQSQLEKENVQIKEQITIKASYESFISSQTVTIQQQQKIDEVTVQISELNVQIKSGWEKVEVYYQQNQSQVTSVEKFEEKVQILQQQLKGSKDFESLVNLLKDLHNKLAIAQKALFDGQVAKINTSLADLNKQLAAATGANKQSIQIQIDSLVAFQVQIKITYTQQVTEKTEIDTKLVTIVQNNITEINVNILTYQEQSYSVQISQFDQQLDDLDIQLTQLKAQLSGPVKLTEVEIIKITQTITIIQKQRIVIVYTRDQTLIQKVNVSNSLATHHAKSFGDKVAECKKQAVQSEKCKSYYAKLEQYTIQIKITTEIRIQLTTTISVQTVIVSQQLKADETYKQYNEIIKQIEEVQLKIRQYRKTHQQSLLSAQNCNEKINIFKQQLNQQNDIKAAASALKDLFAKLPAAQKTYQESNTAYSNSIIQDLRKKIAAASNEEKQLLQSQLDEAISNQARNQAQFANFSVDIAYQSTVAGNILDQFLNGINTGIAQSQNECYSIQLKEYQVQIQEFTVQITQYKSKQSSTKITVTERVQINKLIQSVEVKLSKVKLEHNKLSLISVNLVNQMVTLQLKGLNLQATECKSYLAATKNPSQEQSDNCKIVFAQIEKINIELKINITEKIQIEKEVTQLSLTVELQNKVDASKKNLDDWNVLIQEQQTRITEYKQTFSVQIEQTASFKGKVEILNGQLSRAKEHDVLVAQLKGLLDKLPPLQKAFSDNQLALIAAKQAELNKLIADAKANNADLTDLLQQQEDLNASQNNVKTEIVTRQTQLTVIIQEITTVSVQYTVTLKQQIAITIKIDSDNVQQEQQEQSAKLQAQIAELEGQIDTLTDEQQKLILFNRKQDLIQQRFRADNNKCKAFTDSIEARKQVLNNQVVQLQADQTTCNAALAANLDPALKEGLAKQCAGLKSDISKCNSELKGFEKQKKACEELIASNNINIEAALTTQKLSIAQNQALLLQNSINIGSDIQINQQKLDKMNEQVYLLQNSQRQIQIKTLPAEIALLVAQIAAEKDPLKLAELNKLLAQKKADLGTFTIQVNQFQIVIKKRLDEKFQRLQKEINDREAANKAKILEQAQIDAENLRLAIEKQNKEIQDKSIEVQGKVDKQTKALDQSKYDCEQRDKKARQALVEYQNKYNKYIKALNNKQQNQIIKQKQQYDNKLAMDLKQNTINKELEITKARAESSLDQYRKQVIEEVQLSEAAVEAF